MESERGKIWGNGKNGALGFGLFRLLLFPLLLFFFFRGCRMCWWNGCVCMQVSRGLMHVGTILALPRWGRPTGEGVGTTEVVLVHVWACRRGDGFVECSVPELLPFFPFLLLLSFLCRRRSSWAGARGFDFDMVGGVFGLPQSQVVGCFWAWQASHTQRGSRHVVNNPLVTLPKLAHMQHF